jgi:hypothetical protein
MERMQIVSKFSFKRVLCDFTYVYFISNAVTLFRTNRKLFSSYLVETFIKSINVSNESCAAYTTLRCSVQFVRRTILTKSILDFDFRLNTVYIIRNKIKYSRQHLIYCSDFWEVRSRSPVKVNQHFEDHIASIFRDEE